MPAVIDFTLDTFLRLCVHAGMAGDPQGALRDPTGWLVLKQPPFSLSAEPPEAADLSQGLLELQSFVL